MRDGARFGCISRGCINHGSINQGCISPDFKHLLPELGAKLRRAALLLADVGERRLVLHEQVPDLLELLVVDAGLVDQARGVSEVVCGEGSGRCTYLSSRGG